ncbi:uncharacterized protein UDID_18285 [Ustilago sp. UG-2017a]|nr:uncharacterized protein UDID_18285 [Ustilago sp. UG-2017a]
MTHFESMLRENGLLAQTMPSKRSEESTLDWKKEAKRKRSRQVARRDKSKLSVGVGCSEIDFAVGEARWEEKFTSDAKCGSATAEGIKARSSKQQQQQQQAASDRLRSRSQGLLLSALPTLACNFHHTASAHRPIWN